MKIKDITGQRFGRIVVLGRGPNSIEGQTMFVCQCDCGNKKLIRSCTLKNGMTKSCGCFKRELVSKAQFEDLTGKTFGKWKTLRLHSSINGRPRYECQCACRHVSLVYGESLKRGSSKSCRHCGHRREQGYAAKSLFYIQYKHDAERLGREFDLSFERFIEMCEQNCTYCNTSPCRTKRSPRSESGTWMCNGIDRIDNSVGYIESNCDTSCTTCNYMKSDKERDVFLEHVKKINHHQATRGIKVYSLAEYAGSVSNTTPV